MTQYKIGVVGMDHGFNHAKIANTCLNNAELVAICDLNKELLGNRASELGKEVIVTQKYQDLVDNPDIDIMCIASSDYTHGRMTLAALEAGKHVMVETPLENRDMDLLWKIVRLAERKNLKVQLDIADHWLPETLTMKKLIDDGEIGDPYYVITEYLQDIRQQNKGELMDVNDFRMGRGEPPQEPVSAGAATYAVETAMWFCGEPFTEVFAYGNRKNIPMRNVDDHDVALFRTQSGTIARVQCSKACRRPYKEIIKSVWGTKGTTECSGYLPTPSEDKTSVYATLTGAGSGTEVYDGGYAMNPVPLINVPLPEGITKEMAVNVGHGGVEIHSWLDLLNSIENDCLSTMNIYQAFRVSASQIAVRRSKEENRPVKIPQIMERHEELKPLRPLPFVDVSIKDLY